MCYHKWACIWSFIFVCGVLSEHGVTSNFIFVLNSMSILADIIFINLLLLLTYSSKIHHMFYRENHNTSKYRLAHTVTFLQLKCPTVVHICQCSYEKCLNSAIGFFYPCESLPIMHWTWGLPKCLVWHLSCILFQLRIYELMTNKF